MQRKDSGVLLRKNFAFKAEDVKDDGTFSGYGSVFGNVDSYNEIVVAGAFKNSLAEIKESGDPLPMLWNHNPDEPIGGYTSLEEDEYGLKVTGFLMIDEVARAREVYSLMKRRVIKGLSIGYYVIDDTKDKSSGIRYLNELDLREVSPVTFPANVAAKIEDVKSMLQTGNMPTAKEFEDFLREAGFSKSTAACIVASGYAKLLSRGEPGGEKSDDLTRMLREFKLTPQG